MHGAVRTILLSSIAKMISKNELIRLLPFLIVCVLLFGIFRWFATNDNLNNVIDGDGRGYYAYLPALIIYQDLSFRDVVAAEKEFKTPGYDPAYLVKTDGGSINKYPAGVSILLLPFFLAAYLFQLINASDASGFEPAFQVAVNIAALFYLLLGLLLLQKSLSLAGCSNRRSWIAVYLILLGSNLLYFSVFASSMSHVYSFFLHCAILFLLLSRKDFNFWVLPLASLAIVVRPTNLMFLIIAIVYVRPVFAYKRSYVLPILIAVLPLLVQTTLWYLQNGNWLNWSYPGEGFRFTEPQIWEMLFSFQNGLFIYTPVLLIPFVLLVYGVYKREFRWGALSISVGLVTVLYVMSSWWMWSYGSSYGCRPMIEYLPLWALPLVYLNRVSKRLRIWILGVASFLGAINLIQTYQMERTILHPSAMTFEKYTHVFLKVDDAYRFVLGGNLEPPKLGEQVELASMHEVHPLESGEEFMMFQQFEAVEGIKHIYFECSCEKIRSNLDADWSNIFLVTSTSSENELINYQSFSFYEIHSEGLNEWVVNQFSWNHDIKTAPDDIRCYIWNPQKENVSIRNCKIRAKGIK